MDGCTATDGTGSFTIPTTFLLDLCFPVPSDLDPSEFHILQVASYSGGYVVTLGYNGSAMAAFSVPATIHTWGKVYSVIGIGDYSNFIGRVSIGSLDDIGVQPAGAWSFTTVTAPLQPRSIIPVAQGVSGIQILSNGSLSEPLTGPITFVQGSNVKFRIGDGSNDDLGYIYIDAVGNDDYTKYTCNNQRDLGPPIRTINGIAPTPDGDFLLLPGTCLSFSAIANGLEISDTCSQPCCGCAELEVVNSALTTTQNLVATLTAYSSNLGVQTGVLYNRLSELDGRL
jgi:hypothetical protein